MDNKKIIKSKTNKDGSEKVELLEINGYYCINRIKLNHDKSKECLESAMDLESANQRFKQLTN